jgi:hypothetical protein
MAGDEHGRDDVDGDLVTSAAGPAPGSPVPLLADLAAEIERQDRKYGPFTGTTVLGQSRLAIACLEDEITEVKDAWRSERRAAGWEHTEEELLQVAAVAMRALRDIRKGGFQ